MHTAVIMKPSGDLQCYCNSIKSGKAETIGGTKLNESLEGDIAYHRQNVKRLISKADSIS